MVIEGFKSGLESGGFKEGEGIEYVYKDANFDQSLVAQMLTALEASNPDLFLTVTTPITQASRRVVRNKSLPIVFAPVTDPVDAGTGGVLGQGQRALRRSFEPSGHGHRHRERQADSRRGILDGTSLQPG